MRRIIQLALLLLAGIVVAGCSVLRLAYEQVPQLLYWRIDAFVDVSGEQTPPLREAIDRWFSWHRRTQLPDYMALLARAQREVVEPTTPAAVCAWADEGDRRLDLALDVAVPDAAELMLSLTPEQLLHIERRMAKGNRETRSNFLQPDRAERQAAALKRTAERFETLYGDLDDAQRERLSTLLARSSFDPERWLAERRLRQREMLRTLATVSALGRGGGDGAAALQQAQAAARMLAARVTESPRADYRAYQQRVWEDNCALVATMHNAMHPAQRLAARAKLKGWEDDLRALAAAGPAGGGNGNGPASR